MTQSTTDETRSDLPPRATRRRRFARALAPFAYVFKVAIQPVLLVVVVMGLAFLFGFAQRNFGWFNDAETSAGSATADDDALYACSMLCVFVSAPGRCPVCGMELQRIEVSGDPQDIYGITVDPTARRLANIETVAAVSLPVSSDIEVLGKVAYDETREATIASYVAGRVDDLLVDYTGAQVEKGQPLAVIYSPELYADQVGLLSAREALTQSDSSNERVQSTNQRMYESARRRLKELGLPDSEIDDLESRNRADSRVPIYAPIAGTVVKKHINEGDYVDTGKPILTVVDLSQVWLLLEMFPKDTRHLELGQSVSISLPSRPGQRFEGRISFLNPAVDPQTQTVHVRVVVPNEAGLIRVGDLASARIRQSLDGGRPHVVVPRNAVLMNGDDSVAYVETEPGRFEFRQVEVARTMGDQIALTSGIEPGELVASSGVFMLDSTFNIQGKPSLIDPTRAMPQVASDATLTEAEAREIETSFAPLTPEERRMAEEQVICPVTEVRLGTMGMGTPIPVELDSRTVMICCEGCRQRLVENPDKYLDVLERFHADRQSSGVATGHSEADSPDPTGDMTTKPSESSTLPQMKLPEMDEPRGELPQMKLPEMEAPK